MSLTDAPPTLPTWDPPSQPAASPLDPPPPARPGRGRSTGLVVAVVVLFVMAVGAFVAVGSSRGDTDTLPAVEAYSLTAAAEGTIAARTVGFDLTVTAADIGTVTVSGAVDNETELMTVSTDLSSLLALGDPAMPTFGGDIEMLLDGTTGTIYLGADALGGLLPTSTPWISIDLGVLAEQAGQSFDEMRGELFVDPTESARLLLDADDVVEIGADSIDGVDTVHYQVTVDVAAAIAASPQAGSQLDLTSADIPDAVVYDVWVTADNQLRRASFDLEAAGQQLSMVLDMTTSDDPIEVKVPDGSDVFDITSFLGF